MNQTAASLQLKFTTNQKKKANNAASFNQIAPFPILQNNPTQKYKKVKNAASLEQKKNQKLFPPFQHHKTKKTVGFPHAPS